MDLLLVLDLDGTLLLRKHKKIHKRKYLNEFLEYCFNNYNVAIYTSMLKNNMQATLNTIMTPNQIDKLLFIWCREYTIPDPDPINRWDTIKSIKLIQDVYNYHIILVDDSERKVRFENPNNIILVKQFIDVNESENELKELQVKIENKFLLLKEKNV